MVGPLGEFRVLLDELTLPAAEARIAKLEAALRPFAKKFNEHVQNPKLARSRRDHNERMPGHWPIELIVTMGDGRRAR